MSSVEQILKVLKNERECIKRQVGVTAPDGSVGICDRNCKECDLCLPDAEILEVYDFLIKAYELLQNEGAESYTIRCTGPLSEEAKVAFENWEAKAVSMPLEPLPENFIAKIQGDIDE